MHFSSYQNLNSSNFLEECFYREEERLKTFDAWPLINPKPREMAMVGFYYTGQADRVTCYFCGVEICRWSSNCALMRGIPTNNIPLNLKEFNNILPEAGFDTCGMHNIVISEQYHSKEVNHSNSITPSIRSTLTIDSIIMFLIFCLVVLTGLYTFLFYNYINKS